MEEPIDLILHCLYLIMNYLYLIGINAYFLVDFP